ncbi:dihydroxyacetone kinase transcriptional activator DhaS [Liquorilactobacillus satsumensis]|uniref:Transcription regulator n=1 Tax=Liquorilactobacillus satsumensis DSM 16230 = JCM 12392 TaxID=1423801 RepID=A0A0R1UWV8_9LACO|nr:dihydroxyacetone kinase transcriptional activator DhaS [Liquorilactobacillus satsumensis]KRL97772.1 transcription regulator [Liquorilactobacillus satsumensis DSM 16230 = JCM 12392]
MSDILKKRIASSFQGLVNEQDFEHLSVTLVMHKAKVRRQTFYDYFLDKYDLLSWFVHESLSELIDSNINYLPWEDIIKLTFFELNANRNFYTKCIREQHEFDMTNALAQHLSLLVLSWAKSGPRKDKTENQALIDVLSLGIGHLATHNLLVNHPLDYEFLTNEAIESLNLTIALFNKANRQLRIKI